MKTLDALPGSAWRARRSAARKPGVRQPDGDVDTDDGELGVLLADGLDERLERAGDDDGGSGAARCQDGADPPGAAAVDAEDGGRHLERGEGGLDVGVLEDRDGPVLAPVVRCVREDRAQVDAEGVGEPAQGAGGLEDLGRRVARRHQRRWSTSSGARPT
ncbi:hypothetical protein [Janibacter melonis]|uniref:hypothetical protein n=1 Tax=Janibacter melonis TaxID=262209 RepID=UPI001E38142B|nr:hypothetical protein [Janibacter melonis]MCB5992271.1 hypothetical protein [Janibacter melonis]